MNKAKSVKTVTLSNQWGNWRSSMDLTLVLDSRLTVFTGAMGSGKTSILQGLMDSPFVPFSVFTNKVYSQSFNVKDVTNFAAINELVTDNSLDVTLPLATYSRGEQAIIRLYCSISNKLESVQSDNTVLVLIDDLGDNLHPIWQYKILPLLLMDFQSVQFVITTTSPLVLTHVQPDSLFFVEKGSEDISVWGASESYGKTSERILVDLQGLKTTRPIEVQNCLQRFYQHLDNKNLTAAKRELATVKDMTGHNTDPELTRMELRLTMLSIENEIKGLQS